MKARPISVFAVDAVARVFELKTEPHCSLIAGRVTSHKGSTSPYVTHRHKSLYRPPPPWRLRTLWSTWCS